jgi:hypothetical protein
MSGEGDWYDYPEHFPGLVAPTEAVFGDKTQAPDSYWRVGRKLGRTLYRDGVCVGMVDTVEIAEAIAAAMNAQEKRK